MVTVLNENWNPEEIYTVYGKLENGILSNKEGIFRALTYRSFKEQYNGIEGFYNLRYNSDLKCWIIFQGLEI